MDNLRQKHMRSHVDEMVEQMKSSFFTIVPPKEMCETCGKHICASCNECHSCEERKQQPTN